MKNYIQELKDLRDYLEGFAIDNDIHDDFVVSPCWNGSLLAYDIEQNLWSINFFLKTILYTNSGLIYLSSAFNFFQKLTISTDEDTVHYCVYSHSVTLYLLRILNKYGLIKIVSCDKAGKEDLGYYYEQIGNFREDTQMQMYEVVFYKVRNFNLSDLEILDTVIKLLRVGKKDIEFKVVDGSIKACIRPKVILKSLLSGESFKQFKRQKKLGCEFLKDVINDVRKGQ